MEELSCTVTVGEGSEIHNHDLEYRSTLSHVHARPDGIVEIIPYRPYQEQINEAVKPYIDQYNEEIESRKKAAWDRYNTGEIKTKPRNRDYKKMGYDYYTDHLHDKVRNPHTGKIEEQPMWRSIILGIGDRQDRESGRITQAQAEKILGNVVANFQKDFPTLKLLGAALHVDEQGFYHAHLDYKPLYEKANSTRGLAIGIGQDAALAAAGFTPEQSVINGRDKAPILFNAMRNKIYLRMEEAMQDAGLRLQYGVSQVKDPGKDSSRNQRLATWQATQDAARALQHSKNTLADTLTSPTKEGQSEDQNIAAVSTALENITATLDAVRGSRRSRLAKNSVVVEFGLLDQLKSFVTNLMSAISGLLERVEAQNQEIRELRAALAAALSAKAQEPLMKEQEIQAEPQKQEQIQDLERKEQPKDRYQIWQLKDISETLYDRFMDYAWLTNQGRQPEARNYNLVYEGDLTPDMTLDKLYDKFNVERPADFTGHNMSISDIITLIHGDQAEHYYVDKIGFQPLPDFGKAQEREVPLQEQPAQEAPAKPKKMTRTEVREFVFGDAQRELAQEQKRSLDEIIAQAKVKVEQDRATRPRQQTYEHDMGGR